MNETILVNDLNAYKNNSFDSSKNYTIKTKSINTSCYITKDSKNTTLLKFEQFLSNNYSLINKKEIVDFITINPLLRDLITEITFIIKEKFSNKSLSMEFTQDPEILDFRYINIYIHSNNDSFDNDWETLKIINKKINNLSLLNNSIKKYILVDLW